jgi:hypothetical protein
MLAAEHEAAEILRHMRLKAYAVQHVARYSLRWIFNRLGIWRTLDQNNAAFPAGSDSGLRVGFESHEARAIRRARSMTEAA